jgi:4'-phosphopantetheinyl transferase
MVAGFANNTDIYVWRIDLNLGFEHPDVVERALSDDERSRAARYRLARDREQYRICRFALRQILGSILKINPAALEFTQNAYGKPQLTAGDLRFNLSHSGAFGLIAVANGRELGIDIERMRPLEDALEIASRFFSPGEVQRLSALADDAERTRAFLECWTRKEAFIKAVGEGLSHPLDTFCVSFFPDTSASLQLGTHASDRWVMVNINAAPDYCAALVFERLAIRPEPRVIQREWGPPGCLDITSQRAVISLD